VGSLLGCENVNHPPHSKPDAAAPHVFFAVRRIPFAPPLRRAYRVTPPGMIILIKIALTLFLVFWLGLAMWLLVKYERLFGYHPDDPAETPGARSLNLTQVWSCWLGVFAIAAYFLFR
jgi:hypothetical protein